MNDDKDQISHEDEYQFPEDEFIQGESTGRSSIEPDEDIEVQAMDARREKIMKVFNRIREILSNRIVAAVFAVIILLFFFHFFFQGSSKKNQPVVQQAAVQQTVQQPIQQPSAQMLDQLSGIKQSESTTHETVQQLQSQVSSLQATVSQMSSAHQDYQGALIDLSKKINAMQANEQKLLTALEHKSTKVKKPVTVVPPVYFYTRAVIHNRAWVIGSNGENASMAVGDHLQDYGKIISINAKTGVIKTSSGRMITYAPGDR
jgi:uncharacterized protein with von Willebrand factor type A (vWA) domain